MKYDIENLDIKLKNALQEFSVFSFGDDGYSVCAQKSDYNRTETNGKTLTVFYTNTSLFHLTMSFAAIFLTDIEREKIFE